MLGALNCTISWLLTKGGFLMDMLKEYGPNTLAEMTYKDILKRREKKE
ncbi:hypothetical protein PTL64_14665 [Clostridium perfringens]|nr:hypothetical protein [Clostridium perfringens]